MRVLFISLFILFFSLNSFAQYDQVKAKEIISKTLPKYKNCEDFKVSFKMILEDKMSEDKIMNQGTFWLKKDMYRIELEEQIIATNLKAIWVYLKETNEAQISEYIADEQEINPSVFFNFSNEGYLYGYVGDVKINSVIHHLIELVPENKEISFYKIKIYINPSSNELSRVKVYNKSGTILTFELSDLKPNNKLTDDFFIFKASEYKGVEIIDLR